MVQKAWSPGQRFERDRNTAKFKALALGRSIQLLETGLIDVVYRRLDIRGSVDDETDLHSSIERRIEVAHLNASAEIPFSRYIWGTIAS